METLFWACIACVLYTYGAYPMAVACVARVWGRPIRPDGAFYGSVAVVVAAYNEESTIGRRLDELAGLVAASGREGEVIVISDGSTDRTAEIARARATVDDRIRVVELATNRGKAAAVTAGWAAARSEIVAFADARQSWAPDALECLLADFGDPAVGAVSGDLIVASTPGVMAGVGLYWRFEKWIRAQESHVHSTVGVTGSICAVRRALFRPIPPGTILDDVYWPLGVAMQGYRVYHDGRARAYDRLPERARDEFRRKVRTLSGNFQLVTQLPAALLPWRNPIWVQFVSHKLLRLLAPWALLGALGASALLPGTPYRAAFWCQVAFYALGLAGIGTAAGTRLRVSAAAASFLVLNGAAWLAFWVWATGGAARSWGKVAYAPAVPALPNRPGREP